MKRTYSTVIQSAAPKSRKRSKKSSVPRNSFARNTNGVPAQLKTTLKYATTVVLDPAVGGCQGHTFGANCLYDTDITGAGHQPMGYDQISALYNRYTVTASRIKVSNLMGDNVSSIQGMYGIIFNDDAAITYGQALSKCLEQRNVSNTAITGTITTTTKDIGMSQKMAPYFGLKGSIVGDGEYSARTNTNPNRQCYFTLFYGNDSGIAGAAEFVVQIEFDCVFTEPLELVQS